MDYKKPYLELLNQIADIIIVFEDSFADILSNLKEARRQAQPLIAGYESNEDDTE